VKAFIKFVECMTNPSKMHILKLKFQQDDTQNKLGYQFEILRSSTY